MAEKGKSHRYVLTLPDVGLTKSQINSVKNKFKNNLIETMGGKEALARRRIVIVVVVVVITRDW